MITKVDQLIRVNLTLIGIALLADYGLVGLRAMLPFMVLITFFLVGLRIVLARMGRVGW